MSESKVQSVRVAMLVQGYGFVLNRMLNHLKSRITMTQTENTILQPIRSEASRKHYRSYIDIGAADGDTFIPLARLFDTCVAIEPFPPSANKLRGVVNSSGMNNCYVFECALSQAEGEATLFTDFGNDNSILRNGNLRKGPKVRVLTLDRVVRDYKLAEPYLIKIDVQGSEFAVVKGGLDTLKRECAIFSEFWPWGMTQSGYSLSEYLEFFESLGYTLCNLKGEVIVKEKVSKLLRLCEGNKTFTDLLFLKHISG